MDTFRAIKRHRATYAGAAGVMSLLIGAWRDVIARSVEPETSRVNNAVRGREGGGPMVARTDWRLNRLRPSQECFPEMETRPRYSCRPLISVAGGIRPSFCCRMAGGGLQVGYPVGRTLPSFRGTGCDPAGIRSGDWSQCGRNQFLRPVPRNGPHPMPRMASYRGHPMADHVLQPMTSSGNAGSGNLLGASGKVQLL
jgi:hypothetical protein